MRCTHCTKAHISKSLDVGATEEEISEAFMIASLVTSGTQLFCMRDEFEKLLGDDDGSAPWFVSQTKETGQAWSSFHDAVENGSALSSKSKELIATAVACLARCQHCTRSHIEGSLDQGASKAEVADALMTAAAFAATTQLMWMYEDFQELLA